MDSNLLRMLWSIVETTPYEVLVSFDDKSLRRHLLFEVENQVALSREEQTAISSYITDRTPLIRDLAYT
jgi:hypothetical protein